MDNLHVKDNWFIFVNDSDTTPPCETADGAVGPWMYSAQLRSRLYSCMCAVEFTRMQ